MADDTEEIRKEIISELASQTESLDPAAERIRLEGIYGIGNVWDTDEVRSRFVVEAFLAPMVQVTRIADGVKGTLMFQHFPRFYFNFMEY